MSCPLRKVARNTGWDANIVIQSYCCSLWTTVVEIAVVLDSIVVVVLFSPCRMFWLVYVLLSVSNTFGIALANRINLRHCFSAFSPFVITESALR